MPFVKNMRVELINLTGEPITVRPYASNTKPYPDEHDTVLFAEAPKAILAGSDEVARTINGVPLVVECPKEILNLPPSRDGATMYVTSEAVAREAAARDRGDVVCIDTDTCVYVLGGPRMGDIYAVTSWRRFPDRKTYDYLRERLEQEIADEG